MSTSEYEKDIARRSQLRRRNKFVKNGLCVQCGKVEPMHGRTLCKDCMDKQKIASKKYYTKKKLEKLKDNMNGENK